MKKASLIWIIAISAFVVGWTVYGIIWYHETTTQLENILTSQYGQPVTDVSFVEWLSCWRLDDNGLYCAVPVTYQVGDRIESTICTQRNLELPRCMPAEFY
jgi:hypothetical protein